MIRLVGVAWSGGAGVTAEVTREVAAERFPHSPTSGRRRSLHLVTPELVQLMHSGVLRVRYW